MKQLTNTQNSNKMTTYKLICNTFGHKFSFNAESTEDAISKAKSWCSYHSFSFNDYKVEQTNDTDNIHNEYVS